MEYTANFMSQKYEDLEPNTTFRFTSLIQIYSISGKHCSKSLIMIKKNNNDKESTTFIVKMRIHANLKRFKTTQ